MTTDAASKRLRTPLITARGLTKVFGKSGFLSRREGVRAVDNVDLDIRKGETLGLVGESGSGKSTLGRLILNLTSLTEGQVHFEGEPVNTASWIQMRNLRRRMQIVFQDPYSSQHPRMTVRETLKDALRAGGETPPEKMDARVEELVAAVGLGPAHIDVYPHKLSGGQRQRVAIARALSANPEFIVADEAVSALDVSIQAQILNLLIDLQKEYGLTYLFVSHDLNVIRYLADRVVVMYRGRIVEQAPSEKLFVDARHPYTQLLLRTRPNLQGFGAGAHVTPQTEEAEASPPGGCQFYGRCPIRVDACTKSQPSLTPIDTPDHLAACFRAQQPVT